MISTLIFVAIVLALLASLIFYFVLTPWRDKLREQRDILATGQAAMGTIVAIDEVSQGRGGNLYAVNVEFAAAGFREPLRTQIRMTARDADKLGLHEQVPIHYKDEIPIVAVIDELVK